MMLIRHNHQRDTGHAEDEKKKLNPAEDESQLLNPAEDESQLLKRAEDEKKKLKCAAEKQVRRKTKRSKLKPEDEKPPLGSVDKTVLKRKKTNSVDLDESQGSSMSSESDVDVYSGIDTKKVKFDDIYDYEESPPSPKKVLSSLQRDFYNRVSKFRSSIYILSHLKITGNLKHELYR